MSTTPNRSYPIPDPALAIHPAVRDSLMAIDADVQGIVAGGGAVSSVFGRTGAVVAVTNDYTWAQINKTTSSLADITTRSASDLSSGTLPDARFPATLPAISGVNLTNLNAANLASGTVPAGRMPALTGDVTTSAGAVATTIANNAVSLAKLADIATASFLGRNTAGTGDPEVLSMATAKTMLNLTGTNSGDVTLSGESYLSLAGQALTANQINLAGTHVTSTLPVTKGGTGTATQFTAGSIVFAGASGVYSQSNANLFWDNSNSRLGIGTALPGERLEVAGNIFVNSTTANLFLKDTSTGFQSASTTVVTPLNNNTIRSTSYTSGLIGWNISALGNAEFNNVDVRGAIHAALIVYNAIAATAGTLGVFKSAAKLRTDVTVPSSPTYGTTTVNIDVVDPDGLAHASAQVFAVNDILRMKDGLVGDTWFKVSAASDQTTFWRYTAIIMAGTNNVTYRAGLGVADYGLSGQGFIIQTADQTNAPYLQMATHPATFTSNNSAGTLNVTPQLRIGNLNGSYGFASDTFGLGAGQYGIAGKSWIIVDPTNGVRIGNNTTTLTQIDASGNASFTGSITSSAGTIAGWTIGSNAITKNEVKLAAGANLTAAAGTGECWIGKSATDGPYYGMFLKGTTSALIDIIAGQASIGTAGRPYFQMGDGTRTRVIIGELNTTSWDGIATNSMGMKIWDSAGSLLVHFSDVANVISGWTISTTKITSTGIDILSGASAALSFGSTPPTSASAGTGIWLDRTGLYGLASSVVQAKMDATTGAIVAGAGNVTLDATGIKFIEGTGTTNMVWWRTAAAPTTVFASLFAARISSTQSTMHMDVTAPVGDTTAITDTIISGSNSNARSTELYLRKYGTSHSTKPDVGYAMFNAANGVSIFRGPFPNSIVEPVASAALDVQSTTGAFLPPRMTTTEKNALTPTDGMIVYDTTIGALNYRKAGAWVSI